MIKKRNRYAAPWMGLAGLVGILISIGLDRAGLASWPSTPLMAGWITILLVVVSFELAARHYDKSHPGE